MTHESSAPREVESGVLQSQPVPAQRDALTRRRLLLKGLGKGGAVVAVAAPITTFAVPSSTLLVTATNQLCSQSGQNSLVHSASPITRTTCLGHAPSYYVSTGAPAAPAHWPNGWGATTSIRDILGGGDSTPGSAFIELRDHPTSSTSYWLAAAFNSFVDTNTFPYTWAEVQAQFAANSGSWTFYKNFLSTLLS